MLEYLAKQVGQRVLAGVDSDRVRDVRRSREAVGLGTGGADGNVANGFEGVLGVVGEAVAVYGGEDTKLGCEADVVFIESHGLGGDLLMLLLWAMLLLKSSSRAVAANVTGNKDELDCKDGVSIPVDVAARVRDDSQGLGPVLRGVAGAELMAGIPKGSVVPCSS